MISRLEKYDTIIAGSGIMGLSCAWEEAKRGKSVLVMDKNAISRKASWVAAGIIMTEDAREFYSFFREFYVRSAQMYPLWLAEIQAQCRCPQQVYFPGAYQVFAPDTEQGAGQYQSFLDRLSREKARQYQQLSELPSSWQEFFICQNYQVFFFPSDGYVHSARLLEQLREACQRLGVCFLPHSQITDISEDERQVVVHTNDLEMQGEYLILCAGAWSNELLRLLGWEAPLRGVKGQIIQLDLAPFCSHVVHYQRSLYLTPWERQIFVGATTEKDVWDEQVDDFGKSYLQSKFGEFLHLPSPVTATGWASIRPMPRDRQPWLGFLSSRILICAGHYKSGLAMAPLSAKCISHLIHQEPLPLDIRPFFPWRKKGIQVRQ